MWYRLLGDARRRLGDVPDPVPVMAARPLSVPDVDDRRLDLAAEVGRERAAVDEHARRQGRADLRQRAGDRRQRPLRLAHAVARQRPQQTDRVRVLWPLEDARSASLLDDLAGVHDADPVAHRPDDPEVVRDQQNRR